MSRGRAGKSGRAALTRESPERRCGGRRFALQMDVDKGTG